MFRSASTKASGGSFLYGAVENAKQAAREETYVFEYMLLSGYINKEPTIEKRRKREKKSIASTSGTS